MDNAYIQSISYYLPKQKLSNNDLATIFPEWGVEKIANKIGVNFRHIAGPNEFASDLAISAANKLFEEKDINRDQIDFILYCTQSPDYFLPSTACIIQNKLNIPETAGALDFNLGCSGYIYGLAIAKGLICGGIAKNILLLTSETYSKFIHPDDKGNRTIFGDGAAATIVSTNGFARIEQFCLGTDGKGAPNLIVKRGGMRYPHNTTPDQDQSHAFPSEFLHMDGPQIFAFTAKQVPLLVEGTLIKNNIAKENIDQYVFHQANHYMLSHLRKKLQIPSEKFYNSMGESGNTVSSTIPIALYEAMRVSKNLSRQQWLLAGFGVGYSWGATVITFI